MESLIPLTQAVHEPSSRVGGKAKALGQLMAFGAPVPDGFVVPPELALADAEPLIQSAVQSLRVPGVAVRSSAAGEDAKNQSWAGQFESYLYVVPSEVPARVAIVGRLAARPGLGPMPPARPRICRWR